MIQRGPVIYSDLTESIYRARDSDRAGDRVAEVASRECPALLLPSLRIAEHDPEHTAMATARFVEQNRTVELAQFARDE
jgi:hypothetical protein